MIRSKIKTLASTAIPTVKIIPAIPGKVSVASNIVSIPIRIKRFNTNIYDDVVIVIKEIKDGEVVRACIASVPDQKELKVDFFSDPYW